MKYLALSLLLFLSACATTPEAPPPKPAESEEEEDDEDLKAIPVAIVNEPIATIGCTRCVMTCSRTTPGKCQEICGPVECTPALMHYIEKFSLTEDDVSHPDPETPEHPSTSSRSSRRRQGTVQTAAPDSDQRN